MDARRYQVYNGVYTWSEGVFTELTPPRALSIEECVEDVKKYGKKVIFLGDGVPVHREYIEKELKESANFAPASCNAQRASSLAALALTRQDSKKSCYEISPVYLRKPQAEREREERGIK